DRGEQPGRLLGADDGPGQCRGLAAAIPGQLNVGGEQLPQALDVVLTERAEEPLGQLLPFPAIRLEPRAACGNVATCPHGELAARRLGPTADAISAKPNPNTSRSTNTARSSGLSRSSSSSAAIDTESASSAERSGSW